MFRFVALTNGETAKWRSISGEEYFNPAVIDKRDGERKGTERIMKGIEAFLGGDAPRDENELAAMTRALDALMKIVEYAEQSLFCYCSSKEESIYKAERDMASLVKRFHKKVSDNLLPLIKDVRRIIFFEKKSKKREEKLPEGWGEYTPRYPPQRAYCYQTSQASRATTATTAMIGVRDMTFMVTSYRGNFVI